MKPRTLPFIGQIEKLRKQVLESLSPCVAGLGLKQVSDTVFWSYEADFGRLVQISFLDTRHASYFGTTTASFSVEFGGLYGSATPFAGREDFPAAHYCQVRGKLRRDFHQDVPRKDLPRAEHHRRDIWWVDAAGTDLPQVLESVVRVARKDLHLWLDRLSDHHYLCRYLYWKAEDDCALFGFGKIGSSARAELLALLTQKFSNPNLIKWRVLLPAWLASR